MAEKRAFNPKLVDENYAPPENATPGETLKGQLASSKREGINEGIRRQKAKQDAETLLQIKGVKSAHIDELNRSGKIVSKAAHRDGLLQGIVLGMIAAICVGLATWTVLREVVITNVNVARTPQAAVPALQYDEAPTHYPRDNPREPADARQP